eukprot:TRINITY_DN1275_c0_g2_i2.p1 TRINITY_DN1275_c0_g2~~TRINITY_DN1275_c0_g2_i2.p1  ORF type:complete len:658 (+),score=180.09 TRINITY_DN1275_c0_g2_i2:139-1974(+)
MAALRKAELANLSKEEKTIESVRKINFRDLENLTVEQLLFAFLRSEETYTDVALKALVDFVKRLRVKKISAVDEAMILKMFLNIEAIYDFNCEFLADLKNLTAEGKLLSDLAKTVVAMGPFFKLYGVYVNAQQDASETYRKLANDSSKFAKMLQENHAATGFKVSTLMEIPTLRLPQYLIYLGSLAIKLSSHPEYSIYMEDVQTAIAQLKNTLDSIASTLRDKNAREAVVKLQMEVFKGGVALVDPGRYLIKKGRLILVAQEKSLFRSSKEKILVALFNDMFMIVNSGGSIRKILRVRSIRVDELADNSVQKIKNGFRLSDGVNIYNIECPSQSSRNSWMEEIQDAIDMQTGSVLGSNIDDDYFEKMILKKVPQVALVDSKQIQRDIGAKQSTDPQVGGLQFEQKTDDYGSNDFEPAPPTRYAASAAAVPPPPPAPVATSPAAGRGAPPPPPVAAPSPSRALPPAPAPSAPAAAPRATRQIPPPAPSGAFRRGAAPPPPPQANNYGGDESPVVPVPQGSIGKAAGSQRRVPPPPAGPDLGAVFSPTAVSNPPAPSRGGRALPPPPPAHSSSISSTITSTSSAPTTRRGGAPPPPAAPAAPAPPPPPPVPSG